MTDKNLLSKLQKDHPKGGYALVSSRKQVVAFAADIKKLYREIDTKNISDTDKLVMYVPPPNIKHVFSISLSVRTY